MKKIVGKLFTSLVAIVTMSICMTGISASAATRYIAGPTHIYPGNGDAVAQVSFSLGYSYTATTTAENGYIVQVSVGAYAETSAFTWYPPNSYDPTYAVVTITSSNTGGTIKKFHSDHTATSSHALQSTSFTI